ncbi:hypothetical protein [Tunturiibacter gelidiferens]|uniref:hypothetical protein n=1 Tax=Tunturiibacter gelidiferens TaxID=3069689 RepID=UPI003D9B593C
MTKASLDNASRPAGFLTFTLHAHLPYVVNHGTWPHGLEWLHEAAAETYLPFLRVLKNLERDQIRFSCNLNLSPILLEQLSHPVFLAEFPHYLTRKIVAAREDEAFFLQSGDGHLAETARFWQRFFSQALEDFNHFDRDLISAFRHFNDTGLIDIITCGATHGYMPLLGTDESLRAQIRTAVDTHIRHFGKAPRGIWAPECGYRPAGPWSYPVTNADGSPTPPAFNRIGVEQALSESGLEFFFVDTHLIEESRRTSSPTTAPAITSRKALMRIARPTSRIVPSISPTTLMAPTTNNTPRPSFPAIPAPASRSGPAIPVTPATASTSTSTRSAGPAVIVTGASPAPGST